MINPNNETMTIAQVKRDASITPKELKGLTYMEIIKRCNDSSETYLKYRYINEKQALKIREYGEIQADKGCY